MMKMSRSSKGACQRCANEKSEIKMFSTANNMNPGDVPAALSGLTLAEELLIGMLSPCINVHMLNHGGLASSGHCVTFPQAVDEPAKIFPRLPQEIDLIKVKKMGANDTSKDMKVRRKVVHNALLYLRAHSAPYTDIEISQERLDHLPEEGVLPMLKRVTFKPEAANKHINDVGPAKDQIDHGAEDVTTASGFLLPDRVDNEEETVKAVVRDVLGHDEGVSKDKRGMLIIPWPTRGDKPLSEFTTRHFFSMAFPTLFPCGLGDFVQNRSRTCESLAEWADHLLWYKDGRFARHPFFKFIVHNMINRHRALNKSNFIVKQKLGEDHYTVEELRKKIAAGDTAILKMIMHFTGDLRGTPQYWAQRHSELRALIDYQVYEKKGLPAFFATGSCAEFHWKPLRELLRKYIQLTGSLEQTGDLDNKNVMFKVLQENAHIVGHYFDLRTQSYFENVMKPVFGVTTYWYRQEFAKSRGMIHWHGLCWRNDMEPSKTLHQCLEGGFDNVEAAFPVSEWAETEYALTAIHPAGNDESGQPRKDLWAPPEGIAPAPPEEDNPLRKLYHEQCVDDEKTVEDHIRIVNRTHLHRCSDYCLRKPAIPGGMRVCRMGFGSDREPGLPAHADPKITVDMNGCHRLEMPQNHPFMVQHSRYHAQAWRANGDISIILPSSDPVNPSMRDIMAVQKYVSGYACKGSPPTGAALDLVQDMLSAVDDKDEITGKLLCNKVLMNAVWRDVSAIETCYELSSLPLYRCSATFQRVSLSGCRQLERDGILLTKSSVIDKYRTRPKEAESCSLYGFFATQGKVPVVTGTYFHASLPLAEEYCQAQLLLHWPGWRDVQFKDIKSQNEQWSAKFLQFLASDDCPSFIKAEMERARKAANRKCDENDENEGIGHQNESADEDMADVEQPEWIDLLKPQAHFDEGVIEFEYDDGGPDYDWGSSAEHYPTLGATFIDSVKQEKEDVGLILPDVDVLTLNEDQKKAYTIVMDRLIKYKENPNECSPLRLNISGTAGSGKSYLIKALVKTGRSLFQNNNAVRVICPTGNSANLINGVTLHSFLKVPINNRHNDMSAPTGSSLEELQANCKGVKLLCVDEKSMIGKTTLGWMEFRARCGNENNNERDWSWGGIPVVVFFGDEVQLPPVCDTPLYMQPVSTRKTDRESPAKLHGTLVWQEFEEVCVLRSSVRQANDKSNLNEALLSMREYQTTAKQATWWRLFQWHDLIKKYGGNKMEEMRNNSVFVFPTHDLEWAHNKHRLQMANEHEPVAKIVAMGTGRHAQTASSDKAQGLHRVIYLCKGAKVSLTSNLAVQYGLYNGATGYVEDIIYCNGRSPKDGLPDVVMVIIPKYTGPPFMDSNPTIVPVTPIERRLDCNCCKRKQVPLILGWASTFHRCQGITVGEGEPNRYIVVHPGSKRFESTNPGALFVALSRAKSSGDSSVLPDFAWNPNVLVNDDHLCLRVDNATTRGRSNELKRIKSCALKTEERYKHLHNEVFFMDVLQKAFHSI